MFEGSVPIAHYLTLSAVLFVIGIVGVLVRRNVIVVFMSIEIMLNAVNISLIAFSILFKDTFCCQKTDCFPGIPFNFCNFLAAKLAYKILAYIFINKQ